MIERRLAQRYRDARLATALSLGHAADERRNERLLLASFNDTRQFAPWLEVLEKARVRLAGVYSTPLLAPALAARLGVKSGVCFVMSANRAGLRQCFVENGRLRFARLERIAENGAGFTSVFVRTETERMLQYLGTLRALPRNGPPLRVLLIVADEERAHFERTLGCGAGLAFSTISLSDGSAQDRPAPRARTAPPPSGSISRLRRCSRPANSSCAARIVAASSPGGCSARSLPQARPVSSPAEPTQRRCGSSNSSYASESRA